jgi:glycosyltransferase involved in cell wall biosynthesis
VASDVFVMPAIYEPFGLVYLEALASGIPVIATGLSGAAEIVQDGINGFIITLPEDYPTIAEKIQFLINHREEREEMGMNARKLAERFSFAEYADEIMNLYKDIISRKRLSLP